MYDWLPAWINEKLPSYDGYNSAVHPGITNVFQSAAMRFGHTLVPPGVFVREPMKDNSSCEFLPTLYSHSGQKGHSGAGLRTCNSYWNPQDFIRNFTIDSLIRGMSSQVTEREDNVITPDLRGKLTIFS